MLQVVLWKLVKGMLISGGGCALGVLAQNFGEIEPYLGPVVGMIASNLINLLYQAVRPGEPSAQRVHVPNVTK
jgi:hypothetical protein